ncbi:MAG: ECF transporter S component [Oscillospiraceae bacterium]|nr:ECF transporter S component [Oscillospiraceae bacterium]
MLVIKNSCLRNVVRFAVPFVLIPCLVILGATVFEQRRYIIVAIGVALLSLLLFAAGYEKKPVGSRKMVIVAVMTALCIVGRFIPFFKPITAITVITAIYLGGEAGFLVGALSALLSNFYFGQGPWTPFQMLAWGMIGLLAGISANPLKRHKWFLLVYGVLAGIFYSAVMDIWTVIWYDGSFRTELYLASIVTAIPHTLMYAVSNFIFLWLAAKPFGEKLERIKTKYGI